MALSLIDDYEVMYSANTFPPRVWLKANGNYIGQLTFHPDQSALPQDTMSNGQVNLHYHLEDLGNVLDLLRNEEPIYVAWNGSGPTFENGIYTAPEPTGEAQQ